MTTAGGPADAAPAWRVVAAAVAGESHARSGFPCQDACGWRERPDGTLVAAVSDGAGSAPLGDVGARTAVAAALAVLEAAPDPLSPETLDATLAAAIAAVHAAAAAAGREPRELAATLIVAAAAADRAAAVQVGDGAAVIVAPDGAAHALTRPPVGEHVNDTVFLVSPAAFEGAQRAAWRAAPLRALVLLSDGLQRLALRMPAGDPHGPFFAPLVAFAAGAGADGSAELAAFLAGPRVASRSDDDRALVVATRRDAPS